MGEPPRPSADALMRRLADEPWEFDFFQAARRLECARPDLPRLGRAPSVDQEPIRFGQNPSLRFAPRSVDGLEPNPGYGAPRLALHCFGLFGPVGPLPEHLTEYARARERQHRDRTLTRFLDVFGHRLASFFYRAWAASQLTVSHDRARSTTDAASAPEADDFARFIASLVGIGTPGLADRDAVPDAARLHFAGRLSARTRHPEGLAGILSSYFGVPAVVQEFIGRWVDLPPEHRCRLGGPRFAASLGGRGVAVAGSRMWDCQSTIRVRLGPMSFDEYTRFLPLHRLDLPGGLSFRRLESWVRSYLGDELAWEAQFILRAADIPQTRLGGGARLGWSAWTRSRPAVHDAADLVLQPAANAGPHADDELGADAYARPDDALQESFA